MEAPSINILYHKDSSPSNSHLDTLLNELPTSVAPRAKRYQKAEDAYNFLMGRRMLTEAIDKTSLPLSVDEIKYNEEEKPFLDGLFFSISHSRSIAACAYSEGTEMGLDVEIARDINPLYFRHCFTNTEWQQIIADKTLHTFYLFWTAKESVLKAAGVGLQWLQNIEISLEEQKAVFYESGKKKNLYLKHLNLGVKQAYACLCSHLPIQKITLRPYCL